MRKKLISVILVGLGVLIMVGGILSATVLKPASEVTLTTPKMEDSSYVTIPAEMLALINDSVDVAATAPNGGEVALIVGRTSDITGWIGAEPSYSVTGASDWTTLVADRTAGTSNSGTATAESAEDTSAETKKDATAEDSSNGNKAATADSTTAEADKTEESAAINTDSDMWISHTVGKGTQKIKLADVQSGMSLLAVSVDGKSGAPELAATWTREVTTPLLVPAIVLGALLALAGIALMWLPLGAGRKQAAAAVTARKPKKTVAKDSLQKASKKSTSKRSTVGADATQTSRENEHGAIEPSALPTAATSAKGPNRREGVTSAASRFGFPQASTPAHDPELASAVTSAFHDANETAKFTAFSTNEAVTAVPPARRGGSHASAYSHGSAASAPSANSIASAETLARAAAKEPELNTAQIRKLGLTRRELREMQVASEHTSPLPQVNDHRPATAPTQAPAQALGTPAGSEAQGAGSSRTTSSNWRAAWGVRQGSDETAVQPQPAETQRTEPQFNSGGSVRQGAGKQFAPEPETAQHESAALQDTGTANQHNDSSHDVRTPASWWGTETTGSPATSAPASGASQYATRASARSAMSTRSAASSYSAASTHSAASVHSPASSADMSNAGQRSTQSTPATSNQGKPAGTRRALYSSYRAEAERLSAQEDWPVPAPPKFEEVNDQEGDK